MSQAVPVKFNGQVAVSPPLGLYIHIPWCVKKCPYCDFNSHAVKDGIPEQAYIDALIRDLEQSVPSVWGREVGSIFFGGGTPSLFSPEGIDRLLVQCRTLLKVSPWVEVTLEANPGTFESARFRGYRDAGINRLSLGIQSFNNDHLRALGRIHDASEAHQAAEQAMELFDRVNLDLMYALPQQTLSQVEADLATAIALHPQHLSAYHLTLEPNTPFAATPPPLPEDDLAADMQECVEATLAAAGYAHYETSAFALPGGPCRHNLNYWTFGDYLGIGAGAHGKLTFHDRIERQTRPKHPRAYMQSQMKMVSDPISVMGSDTIFSAYETRELSRADRVFEFMMNALRLNDGFALDLFTTRTGLAVSALAPGLEVAEARGLIQRDLHHVRPTLQGRRFLNELLQLFLQ